MSLAKTVFFDMYAHGYQINRLLLNLAQNLTPEQWSAPQEAGQRSLHETFFHLLDAEAEWLYFCEHGRPVWGMRDIKEYPNVATLQALSDQTATTTLAYLEKLDEAGLVASVHGMMPHRVEQSAVIWQILTHTALHSVQHRSELAAMLTRFGYSPGSIDIYGYFWIAPYRS